MTDINIKPIQIDISGASDGQALIYSASNNTLEYRAVSGSEANLYNTYLTLSANDFNTLNTARANDYTTYLAALANDGVTVATARGNDHSTLLSAQANDGATLLSARANDYTTYLAALANDGVSLATARGNDHATLLSAQANDFSTFTNLSANDFNTLQTTQANDYTTYLAALANDGVTLASARGNDHATLLSAYSNDYSTFLAVEANVYNTFQYLNANSGGGGGDVSNAWVNANDYNTYTTLKSQIDLVNSNTASLGSVYADKFEIDGSTNVFTLSNSISSEEALLVYIDGVLQHSDAYVLSGLTLTLANTLPLPIATLGVRSLSALAASGTANLASDYYILNGSTNVFSLSRSVTGANNILVSLSGVVQAPDVHYVVSSNTLTIANSEPLAANVVLEVRHLSIVNQTVGGGSTGGVSYLKTYALG